MVESAQFHRIVGGVEMLHVCAYITPGHVHESGLVINNDVHINQSINSKSVWDLARIHQTISPCRWQCMMASMSCISMIKTVVTND